MDNRPSLSSGCAAAVSPHPAPEALWSLEPGLLPGAEAPPPASPGRYHLWPLPSLDFRVYFSGPKKHCRGLNSPRRPGGPGGGAPERPAPRACTEREPHTFRPRHPRTLWPIPRQPGRCAAAEPMSMEQSGWGEAALLGPRPLRDRVPRTRPTAGSSLALSTGIRGHF